MTIEPSLLLSVQHLQEHVHLNSQKMVKDNALSSCTTGVEHAENVDTKDTAEILVGQLEHGFDDRDASVLKSKERRSTRRMKKIRTVMTPQMGLLNSDSILLKVSFNLSASHTSHW